MPEKRKLDVAFSSRRDAASQNDTTTFVFFSFLTEATARGASIRRVACRSSPKSTNNHSIPIS
jgi:hypothetical protein